MATEIVHFVVVIHDAFREEYRFQVFGHVMTSVSIRRALREIMRHRTAQTLRGLAHTLMLKVVKNCDLSLEYDDPTGRVQASWHQTVASTGAFTFYVHYAIPSIPEFSSASSSDAELA